MKTSAKLLCAIALVTTGCVTTDTSSLKTSAAPEVTAAARDYAAAVHRCATSGYATPANHADATKASVVRIKVGADGKFEETGLTQSSGVAAVDDAVLAALRSCSGKVAPPEAQRAALQRDGLELAFRP